MGAIWVYVAMPLDIGERRYETPTRVGELWVVDNSHRHGADLPITVS
jgi:hypothetical protein